MVWFYVYDVPPRGNALIFSWDHERETLQHYFTKLLFYQFIILPIYYFIKLLFYQIIILPNYYFTKLLFYQIIVLPIYYFTKLLFYQFIILPNYYFTNLLFYQFIILPNKLLVFGHRNLIKNIKQTSVINILKHTFYELDVSYASTQTFSTLKLFWKAT